MKLSDLLKDIPVLEMNVDPELEITGVSYDSRKVRHGHMFVAITGYAADGHQYIPMALSKGADCILCERRPADEVPFVLVPNSRVALAQLGANWFGRPADRMTILGVTGTNGKTSITYLLKSVLEQTLGAKVGLIGTIQNMIGEDCLPTEHTTPESFELQKLFAETSALYRLDSISGSAAGSADLGPLPPAAVTLLVTLAVVWVLIGLYVLFDTLKKKKKH